MFRRSLFRLLQESSAQPARLDPQARRKVAQKLKVENNALYPTRQAKTGAGAILLVPIVATAGVMAVLAWWDGSWFHDSVRGPVDRVEKIIGVVQGSDAKALEADRLRDDELEREEVRDLQHPVPLPAADLASLAPKPHNTDEYHIRMHTHGDLGRAFRARDDPKYFQEKLMKMEVFEPGDQSPTAKRVEYNRRVLIDYTIRRKINGAIVETTAGSEPRKICMGRAGFSDLVSGFELALIRQTEGFSGRIIIPPEMAYKNYGLPSLGIGAGETLIVDFKIHKIFG